MHKHDDLYVYGSANVSQNIQNPLSFCFPPDVELSHIKSDIFHKHLLQPTNFCKLFAHGYQMSDCIRSLAIRRIYLTDVSSCVEYLHTNISENLSEVSEEINSLSWERCNVLVKAKTLRMVTWDKHIF